MREWRPFFAVTKFTLLGAECSRALKGALAAVDVAKFDMSHGGTGTLPGFS